MGVKTHYQLTAGHSIYSDIAAYYQLVKTYTNLFAKPYPKKVHGWRKDIPGLYQKLTHDWGVNAVGQLSMVKTRNGRKFGLGKVKVKPKKPAFDRRPRFGFAEVQQIQRGVEALRRMQDEFAPARVQVPGNQAVGPWNINLNGLAGGGNN